MSTLASISRMVRRIRRLSAHATHHVVSAAAKSSLLTLAARSTAARSQAANFFLKVQLRHATIERQIVRVWLRCLIVVTTLYDTLHHIAWQRNVWYAALTENAARKPAVCSEIKTMLSFARSRSDATHTSAFPHTRGPPRPVAAAKSPSLPKTPPYVIPIARTRA